MADVVFRIPQPDEPGFVRFSAEIDSSMAAFERCLTRFQPGQKFRSADVIALVDAMLPFVAGDRAEAREAILDMSMPALQDGIERLSHALAAYKADQARSAPAE